jgi:hypothetical protein
MSTTREATRRVAIRKFPSILWNPKVHYHIHSSPLVSILIMCTPPHPIPPRSILIFYAHLCVGLPSRLLPSGFPTKYLYAFLSPIHATCPINLIERKLQSSSLCSFVHSPVTSSFFSPIILLITLLLITVVARSKARTVFACSNTEIVDSNPTGGTDVCVFCVRLFCAYPMWRWVRILPP